MPAILPPSSGSAGVKTVSTVSTDLTTASATNGSPLLSLSTPLTVNANVASGQVVDIEATWNGKADNDTIIFWGIRRNSDNVVLVKGTWYNAGGGTRPQTGTVRWTDTSPGTGTITYELLLRAFSGVMTAYGAGDGSTSISPGLSPGAGTQISARVRS